MHGAIYINEIQHTCKMWFKFCFYYLLLQSLLYKKVMDAQNRDKITNELMIYHMKVLLYFSIYRSVVICIMANNSSVACMFT